MAAQAVPIGCLLVFFCLSSLAIANAQADFTVLTLVWPGTYCKGEAKSGCCRPTTGMPKLEFYIQGLQTYSTAQKKLVTKCKDCKFYVNRLKDLIPEMYNYWPDVRCPSNNGVDLWKADWCYYGTCTNLSQTDYFNNSLALRDKYDPLFILNDYDMGPSNTEKYSFEDIKSALLPSYGFSFFVECDSQTRSKLYKVHLCVSIDGKRLITCPLKFSSNCKDTITFPPYTANMLKGVDPKLTAVSVNDEEELSMSI